LGGDWSETSLKISQQRRKTKRTPRIRIQKDCKLRSGFEKAGKLLKFCGLSIVNGPTGGCLTGRKSLFTGRNMKNTPPNGRIKIFDPQKIYSKIERLKIHPNEKGH